MNLLLIILVALISLIAGYFWGLHHTFDALLSNLSGGHF